jgi:threonine synthase
MRYISTRGVAPELGFAECVLEGLAEDGGLYVPKQLPAVTNETLVKVHTQHFVRSRANRKLVVLQWSTLPFADLALEIMSLFVPEEDVPRADLHDILKRSFGTFRDEAVTPVVQV